MKNYLVIGNPIEHSLSPKIHNYWFTKHEITANYVKKKVTISDLENVIKKVKNKEINGANITVPFKEKIISYVDKLTEEANQAQSVNTLYLSDNKIIGHNTDIIGFELSLKERQLDFKNNNILILGAGGVTPSIIIALKNLGASKITISNRTKEKAIKLKERFKFIDIIDWGQTINAKTIINTTSLGLNKNDNIKLDFNLIGSGCFFYDLIYNPKETNFLQTAKSQGYKIQNGLMMFVYQAAESFKIWNDIDPKVDNELINLEELDVPLYTPIEEEKGIPSEIKSIMEKFINASGFIICAPEYNGSIPPVLTNIIAWISVIDADNWRFVFNGKIALMATHSGGGGNNLLQSLRIQLNHLGTLVLPRTISINSKTEFNHDSATEKVQQLIDLILD